MKWSQPHVACGYLRWAKPGTSQQFLANISACRRAFPRTSSCTIVPCYCDINSSLSVSTQICKPLADVIWEIDDLVAKYILHGSANCQSSDLGVSLWHIGLVSVTILKGNVSRTTTLPSDDHMMLAISVKT